MYCKLQMLFTIVYCSEPTKRIQAILGYSLPKTLSPGVASGIRKLVPMQCQPQDSQCGTKDWHLIVLMVSSNHKRLHEVAATRVTRVPGPASATCTVLVCLQLIHLAATVSEG